MVRFMRDFFDRRGFIEVETPILWSTVGGAAARPFLTRANALSDMNLSMRIAPELFLKQLVIGGFERVYEMSKVFRNEGALLSPRSHIIPLMFEFSLAIFMHSLRFHSA